jgi:Protein of unknown function (DUF1302)
MAASSIQTPGSIRVSPHPMVRTAIAAAMASLVGAGAQAFEFDSGNPDLTARWDNTVRYNLAKRVEGRDSNIGNNALSDEGTYSFDRGDIVANRLDLLSELDVVYQNRMGLRLSATAWHDAAYDGNSGSNPAYANISSYPGRQYSPLVNRLYKGTSGEVMDAFVFANFDLADVPVKTKLGRHTVYWGESLLLGGNLHGVAYAQNPLDLQKGFATPGVEVKELFRPLNQLSVQAQVSDTVSLAANYMLEWESARYPEGGTYLGPVDFAFNGPSRQYVGAPFNTFVNRGQAFEPKQSGEWGASARWSPDWLDGTLGFYYRNFADKLPHLLRTAATTYNTVYADNIRLVGMSLSKNIGGVSLGAEVSHRNNTPLNSRVLLGPVGAAPAVGDTFGARGDTWHALVNALGVVPKTALFDSATWAAELAWSRWDKVRSGAQYFNAVGFGGCVVAGAPGDKWDGCATKDYVGVALAFTPTWFQVFPGVDMTLPVTYAVGVSGNAATTFGGNQGLGNYSVGLGFDVHQKHRFDLKYIDYLGRYKTGAGPLGQQVSSTNGLNTYLKDRGFMSLTYKTSF